MQTAILFPGQGSQTPGISVGFMTEPATRELFQLADDTLSLHLTRLMKEGPEEDLRATHHAQPALLLAGIAALTYLLKNSGKTLEQFASFVAGHSLGEYTAVSAAGGMNLPAALKLVHQRGLAMSEAVPAGQGAMSAIIGLELASLIPITVNTGAYVANDNGGNQIIISGPTAAIESAEAAAKEAGAKRVLRLNVAGPFHTPAMQPAARAVASVLKANPLNELTVPCVMNATAEPATTAEQVSANLVTQITSPVRWRESMLHLASQGITQVIELGAGKVLTGLAPRIDARLSAIALDSPEAIDSWLESLEIDKSPAVQ